MKLLTKFTEKIAKIKIESSDDLWTLSTILDSEDIIRGKTIRKVTIGDKNTEKSKVSKKPMFLGISAEKISFENDTLKILGTIIEGPEDIPRGSHHSFSLKANDEIEIEKTWLNYQIKKLKESCNKEDIKIISCIFNREEAIFGKLQRSFFVKLSKITGTVAKKEFDQKTTNFFAEITKNLNELNTRLNPNFIIMGSSHFWQAPMKKEIETSSFSKKCIYTTVNSITESGLTELLLKPEVGIALKNQSAIVDAKTIDEVFKLIMAEAAVCYGLKDCKTNAELGAIEKLICTDNLIKTLRDEDKFKELEEMFKLTETNKGNIHIMSGNSDAIKRLDGIGGVCAILRYKI